MTLYEKWTAEAYDEKKGKDALQKFWKDYFEIEKGIYAELLKNPDEEVKGSVKDLAEKYNTSVFNFTGFLDGINDSLVEKNPLETMEEDTVVSLKFDKEKLYRNMVAADADWLYNLPAWDSIFTEEERHKLYLVEKKSHTLRRTTKKVGRNDPCPCGSGKKYKNCCMKKDQEAERQAIKDLQEA